MSSTHPIWFVSLPGSEANIGLTPCPGTQGESLEDSLKRLKEWGASAILTLMPSEEMQANDVTALPEECEKLGIQWFHFPVKDDEGPAQPFFQAWEKHGQTIHELLNAGKSVAIHCKGGSGRTGLLAGQIMLEQGMKLAEIIPMVQAQRPNAFTVSEQQEYIRSVAENLK